MKNYTHREVELQCGDLGSITANYFVDYEFEDRGYYSGKYFINSQKLFATFIEHESKQKFEVDLTSQVSSDVLDDLFNVYIIGENQ